FKVASGAGLRRHGLWKCGPKSLSIIPAGEASPRRGMIFGVEGPTRNGSTHAWLFQKRAPVLLARRFRTTIPDIAGVLDTHFNYAVAPSLTDTSFDTPGSCMVTPYSTGAMLIVFLLWVISTNWVATLISRTSSMKRPILASSSGASTSSRMQKG